MENQVLSVSQMRELIKLGVDTSKASMFWHPSFYRCNGILDYDTYEDIPTIKLQNNYNLDYDILAFTLQDILDIIKEKVLKNDLSLNLELDLINNQFQLTRESDYRLYTSDGKTLLQSAFNMLKWCKRNNYI